MGRQEESRQESQKTCQAMLENKPSRKGLQNMTKTTARSGAILLRVLRPKAAALFLAALLLSALSASAQQPSDSSSSKPPTRLREVRVSAEAPRNSVATTAPVQTLSQETLERQVATQLSDAAKEFTGVTIRDYGGIGGIKSFSARGLGSQFSSLVIDGIVVGDAQNGHVDLGRYLVDGVRHVSFTASQYDGLLQSARTYAAGNLLSLESSMPSVDSLRPTHLRMTFRGGSFGLVSPTLAWQQRITDKRSARIQSGRVFDIADGVLDQDEYDNQQHIRRLQRSVNEYLNCLDEQ